MDNHAYRAHEYLVAPARRYPQIWRLLTGLILIAAIATFLSRAAQTGLAAILPRLFANALAIELGNDPASLLFLLFCFGFVIVGVMVATRVIQKRDPLGVIGPLPLALRQFWQVARILLLLWAVILLLPPYGWDVELQPNLEFRIWILLLPLSLFAVLVQTSAEEILFRGYMQQALAARFRSPMIWIGAPALVFALGHYLPEEAGANALLIALWSGAFALATADLTARSGTLGPAIAVHLFNNITALLILGLPDSLSGLTLYTLPYSMSDTTVVREWLAVDFAMMFVSWLAARVVIRR